MRREQDREGVKEALIERFERQRLPRILALKAQVDQGSRLSNADLGYLEEVLDDARQNAHIIAELPSCQGLYAQVMHLYREITERALANEQSRD